MASSQLIHFFDQELVNVCFGNTALLAGDSLEQAVTDFNLADKRFTFVDRAELAMDKLPLLKAILAQGAVYRTADAENAGLLLHL